MPPRSWTTAPLRWLLAGLVIVICILSYVLPFDILKILPLLLGALAVALLT